MSAEDLKGRLLVSYRGAWDEEWTSSGRFKVTIGDLGEDRLGMGEST